MMVTTSKVIMQLEAREKKGMKSSDLSPPLRRCGKRFAPGKMIYRMCTFRGDED